MKQKIKTFLWFDNNAEEAAQFYTSIFKDSKILHTVRCGEGGPGPAGSVLTVAFQLAGVEFVALNGGPVFKFTEAMSLTVDCETQEEVDELWEKLSLGGEAGQCGWLKDRYGLSWQIVPSVLPVLLSGPQPEKSRRVIEALMQMQKLDIQKLTDAYEGR
ncbi:MAG: VOC family protein [Bdellovibrionota bacterium]